MGDRAGAFGRGPRSNNVPDSYALGVRPHKGGLSSQHGRSAPELSNSRPTDQDSAMRRILAGNKDLHYPARREHGDVIGRFSLHGT